MTELDIIYLVFVFIIGTLRGYYQRRFGKDDTIKGDQSLADRLVLGFGVLAMAPIPLVAVLSDAFAFADVAQPGWLSWLGVPFLVLGTWLFWRSHADLGANWSAKIRIRAHHTLVDTGIYRLIRHPMYAALTASGIGQTLVLQNWLAGPSLLVAAILFYVVRIPREERMLELAFGEAYRHYVASTGRIFPKLSLLGRHMPPT